MSGQLPTEPDVRPCPVCEGAGCEECDDTGQRVTTHIDLQGGGSMRVHGSAPLSPEVTEALAEVGRLALEKASELDELDKSLYGFRAQDADGNRIDPTDVRP